MYTSITIKNFRNLHDLTLDNLARINLIAGKNGIGKTAALEAIFIVTNPFNPELIYRVLGFRGLSLLQIGMKPNTLQHNVFREFDIENPIMITRQRTDGLSGTLEISSADDEPDYVYVDEKTILQDFLPIRFKFVTLENNVFEHLLTVNADGRFVIKPRATENPLGAFFISPYAPAQDDNEVLKFSDLVFEGKEVLVLEALQIIEPRLNKLILLNTNGRNLLHGVVGAEKPKPIGLLGAGLSRLATMVLNISHVKANGAILIDEIENGFHYEILPRVWAVLREVAEHFDVQVFASTHSYEMIRAAQKTFEHDKTFRYFRLGRSQNTGAIYTVTYDQEGLEFAVEHDYEVR